MIVGNLTALFNLDSSNFSNGLRKVEEDTKAASKKIQGLGDSIGAVVSKPGVRFLGWTSAIGFGLFTATKRIAHMIAEVDSLHRTLRFASGSVEKATENIAFLTEQSNRLGISLEVSTRAFSQLAVSANNTALTSEQVENIFLSLAEASAVLGLSTQRTELAFLAVQQMISKGVISMEELRRQLGENLPGAMGIMAKSLGVTVAQLNKMVSSGALLADEVLPLFAEELRENFGGSISDLGGSIQVSLGKMETAWFNLKGQLSDGVVAASVKTTIAAFAGLITVFTKTISGINSVYNAFKSINDKLKGAGPTGTIFFTSGSIYSQSMKEEIEDFKDDVKDTSESVAESFTKVEDETKRFSDKFKESLDKLQLSTKMALADPLEAAEIRVKAERDSLLGALNDYTEAREITLKRLAEKDERYLEVLEDLYITHGKALVVITDNTEEKLQDIRDQRALQTKNKLDIAFEEKYGSQLALADSLLSQFGDVWAEWATGSEVSFRELFESMGRQIVAFTLKLLVLKPILEAIRGSLFGGFAADQANNSIMAFAGGGVISEPVLGKGLSSGKGYLLGENGPETVTPGSGTPGNVNITINALDSKSVTELLRENPQAVTTPIVEALSLGDRGLSSALRVSLL